MPKLLPDDQIAEGINPLNSNQREVFNVFHKWAKDYVKCNGNNVEPLRIFLSGSRSTGKCHLVEIIHKVISETLLYRCKGPEKPRVLLLGLTGISAINIGGTNFILAFELSLEQRYLI